jgi:hypothetical protein
MTIPMNPILEKEIRTRLRGARAFQLLFAYVLLQVLIIGGLILKIRLGLMCAVMGRLIRVTLWPIAG